MCRHSIGRRYSSKLHWLNQRLERSRVSQLTRIIATSRRAGRLLSNLFGVYLDLVDGLQTSGCGDKIGAGKDTPHGRDIGRLPGRPKALFTEGDPPSEESRRVVDSCEDVDFLIFCCFLG